VRETRPFSFIDEAKEFAGLIIILTILESAEIEEFNVAS